MKNINFWTVGRALLLVVSAWVLVGTAAAQNTGTFTDSRDGKKYKTADIKGLKWMAENLNYKSKKGTSWCFGEEEAYCKKYGRLYDWDAAVSACPNGWKLPDTADWRELVMAVGWGIAYGKLKSARGWNKNGNGWDEFGFSALPGGARVPGDRFEPDGYFIDDGANGYWWTASKGDGYSAYSWDISYDSEGEKNDKESWTKPSPKDWGWVCPKICVN